MDNVLFANEAAAINAGLHVSPQNGSHFICLGFLIIANHGANSALIILANKWLTSTFYSATQH